MIRLSYYPGCSLKSSSSFYDRSLLKILSHYGIELNELDGWSCCGAAAAPTIDEELSLILSGRNIALSEAVGLHLVAPCSACYSRMKSAVVKIADDRDIRDTVNQAIAPMSCRGSIEVKNLIEVFLKYVGIERIAESGSYDLGSLRFASYYGCLLTRIAGVPSTDEVEDPTGMDDIIKAIGGGLVSWQYKTECCGAASTITDERKTARLSGRLHDAAHRAGAHAIVTTCPLCHLNLDLTVHLRQDVKPIPVLFLSEVFELALFGNIAACDRHLIPVNTLLDHVKSLSKATS
ncbi:MAG: CoB--CoM heterodisulfide reductase iron-sulfur subunit B family protein [Syntrophorhabdaceae bacterium]